MVILGILLLLGGIASAGYGILQNNDLEAQLASVFTKGSANPGTIWIIAGVAVAVIGLVLLIVGLSKKKKS